MDNDPGKVESVAQQVHAYVNMRWNVLKLSMVEGLSKFCSSAIGMLIFVLLAFVGVILLSGALVIWLSALTGSMVLAFVISGVFFLILACIGLLVGRRVMPDVMVRMFSKMFFPEKERRDDYEEE